MTSKDLLQIKESISRIEKFPAGYPRLIDDVPEKWKEFFRWEYDLCYSHANTVDKPHGQLEIKL